VVALNRAIAIAERDGAEQGLDALYAIDDRDRLASYPFYSGSVVGDAVASRQQRCSARELPGGPWPRTNATELGFLKKGALLTRVVSRTRNAPCRREQTTPCHPERHVGSRW
jgi:hypothetical protein